ncbi:unnamed protein product [Anisakis simplex]|uniref:TM2 domain-containing protein n=1 Tax=Anisakis simplex TaxID=6269 RepID=A0A0M3KCY5_ANISI|nr:unnamed protein product [Anisakis simplex]
MRFIDWRWLLVICTAELFHINSATNPISIPKTQKHGNIVIAAVVATSLLPDDSSLSECDKEGFDLNPAGPLVPCSFLDERSYLHYYEYSYVKWIECDEPVDISSTQNTNITKRTDLLHSKIDGGCYKFGGTHYETVERTNVTCRVLPCIECRGARTFTREVPCIKYTGHYFLSTLLYSIFLGMLAVDRFCLGYSAIAVGKLMTLGGLGLWWIVDIFLLITGSLTPADGSNWMPYY